MTTIGYKRKIKKLEKQLQQSKSETEKYKERFFDSTKFCQQLNNRIISKEFNDQTLKVEFGKLTQKYWKLWEKYIRLKKASK